MHRDISYWVQIAPFELSKADREVLGQTDDEYMAQTWEELKVAIG
jgi:hypothetical protein